MCHRDPSRHLAGPHLATPPASRGAQQQLDELGYAWGGGELGCDQGAAVYFHDQADAETFAGLYGPQAVGTAPVTLYCLD